MRVLFVCPNLASGGAERQWSILVPGLVERSFDATVLTLDGEGRFFHELRNAGIAVHCARMRGRTDLRGIGRALSFARLKPDVVVSWSVSAQVVGQLLAWKARVPHLTTEHTPCDREQRARPLKRHQRVLVRLVAPHSKSVVAVTSRQIPALLERGFRSEQVKIIPNGVAEMRVVEPRHVVRARLGFDDSHFVALLVANLRPEKRVPIFVRAAVRAHGTNPRVRGVVVGGGPEFDSVSALVRRTDGAVQLLGERSDVPDLLSAADVVCLSSSAEGIPMILLEAMAAGRPVIATDVGGNAEVVTSETGILVPAENEVAFTDAMLTLAASPVRCHELGRQGRKRQAELYTAERMVEEYERLLLEAAGRSVAYVNRRSRESARRR